MATLDTINHAAAYDLWFCRQVQTALDDPRPALSNEEVKQRFSARRGRIKAALARHEAREAALKKTEQ